MIPPLINTFIGFFKDTSLVLIIGIFDLLKSGLTAIIQVGLHVMIGDPETSTDFEPACGADLREMGEKLVFNLNAIRKFTSDSQRLSWVPTGYGDDRMIDNIELLQIWTPSYDLDGQEALIAFAVESPFPYAIDATELDPPTIDVGDDSVLTNAGNSEMAPVFKLHGPVTVAATITNITSGVQITYDPALPGAVNIPSGHYAEINVFNGTCIKDSDGDNLIAGIDPAGSDFWPIFNFAPGDNDVGLSGAGTLDVIYNNAWA